MVPERLKPLLSSLENPPANDNDFWQANRRLVSPVLKKLIEDGLLESLTLKFDTNDKLEEFVTRAAVIIAGKSTPQERQENSRKFLKEMIDDFIEELEGLDEEARYPLAGAIPYRGKVKSKSRIINCYKELEEARKSLYKWMDKHLRQAPPFISPKVQDWLIRLFQEFLPGEKASFMDKHIKKMLASFGIEYKKRSIEARIRRDYSK